VFVATVNISEIPQIDVTVTGGPSHFMDGSPKSVASVTAEGSRRFLETVLHAVADAMTAEESF